MYCHLWWHSNPLGASKFFREKFPARVEYLKVYQGGKPAKISTSEMEMLYEVLKDKLKNLQDDTRE